MHCEYGSFLDEALCDRFVCGLQNEATQKKQLVEANLTFPWVVEIAQSMETAATKTRQLHAGEAVETVNSLDKPDHSCYRCGRSNHSPAQYPFKKARCYNCGKVGHIKDACLGTKQWGGFPPHNRGRRTGSRSRSQDVAHERR